MNGKMFHISDVLSIGTERLVSTRHMDGVYDVLNYMTQDDLTTLALLRASDKCLPYILKLYPWMGELDLNIFDMPDDWTKEQREDVISKWLEDLIVQYGEELVLYPVASEDWVSIDPVAEAINLIGEDKVVVIEVDNEEQDPTA